MALAKWIAASGDENVEDLSRGLVSAILVAKALQFEYVCSGDRITS